MDCDWLKARECREPRVRPHPTLVLPLQTRCLRSTDNGTGATQQCARDGARRDGGCCVVCAGLKVCAVHVRGLGVHREPESMHMHMNIIYCKLEVASNALVVVVNFTLC